MKTISDKHKFCLSMFVVEMYTILAHKNFPKILSTIILKDEYCTELDVNNLLDGQCTIKY